MFSIIVNHDDLLPVLVFHQTLDITSRLASINGQSSQSKVFSAKQTRRKRDETRRSDAAEGEGKIVKRPRRGSQEGRREGGREG